MLRSALRLDRAKLLKCSAAELVPFRVVLERNCEQSSPPDTCPAPSLTGTRAALLSKCGTLASVRLRVAGPRILTNTKTALPSSHLPNSFLKRDLLRIAPPLQAGFSLRIQATLVLRQGRRTLLTPQSPQTGPLAGFGGPCRSHQAGLEVPPE